MNDCVCTIFYVKKDYRREEEKSDKRCKKRNFPSPDLTLINLVRQVWQEIGFHPGSGIVYRLIPIELNDDRVISKQILNIFFFFFIH